MYIMLILVIAAVIFSIIYAVAEKNVVIGILCLLATVLSGFLVGCIIALIIGSCFPDSTKNTTEKHVYWIYNLQDNSKISGNFSLGCGRVDEKMVYTFYINTGGGYVPMNLDVEECLIRERDGSPEITQENYSFKNKELNNWFFMDDGKYIIYVPKGTIISNYTLDAKY